MSRRTSIDRKETGMNRIAVALFAALLALAAPLHAADKAPPAAAKPAAAQPAAADKIDINRAKADELMKLEGIGEARAKAIIKGRPYKGKDELVEKNIIPQAVYDKIKDQIIAKQK
jgi:DNA uptake protein ComE-like DNA-binding protein